MPKLDPRIDAYIAKAPAFAQPVLAELRSRIHAACPEVEETVKWGAPAFVYHGPLAGMAAFKAHCAFGFWKSELLQAEQAQSREAWGSFGRITGVGDLPTKARFKALVKQAMALNEQGVKSPRGGRAKRPEAPVPPELAAALARNARARATFEGFAPSHRREYVQWIAEAKKHETRARRVAQAVEWLAEGKQRNWKYQ
ncbi:MAG: hypothetical protein RL148_855 [Planctomycetota bacterium]